MTDKDLTKNAIFLYYLLFLFIIAFILRKYLFKIYLPVVIPVVLLWLPVVEMWFLWFLSDTIGYYNVVDYLKLVRQHWLAHVIIYGMILVVLTIFLVIKGVATW